MMRRQVKNILGNPERRYSLGNELATLSASALDDNGRSFFGDLDPDL